MIFFKKKAYLVLGLLLIIGLIFSLIISNMSEDKGYEIVDFTCVNMATAARDLDMFKLDNGVYPSEEEGFASLLANPNRTKYVNYAVDGYMKDFPKDAWGGKILYVKTKDRFDLISYGADRKEGGEDENADKLYSECRK